MINYFKYNVMTLILYKSHVALTAMIAMRMRVHERVRSPTHVADLVPLSQQACK